MRFSARVAPRRTPRFAAWDIEPTGARRIRQYRSIGVRKPASPKGSPVYGTARWIFDPSWRTRVFAFVTRMTADSPTHCYGPCPQQEDLRHGTLEGLHCTHE